MPTQRPFLYSLIKRGLLALMDDEDEPRGLFGYFGDDSADEGTASPGGSLPDTSPAAVPDDDARDSTLDYLGRQLSLAGRQVLTNPMGLQLPTRDPVSGELRVVPYLKSIGERYSQTASNLPFPTGMAPPRPTARAVTTLPRSEPGFLFGGPQAETVEDEAYRLPPEDYSGEDEDEDCYEQQQREERVCWNDYGAVFGPKHHSYTGCIRRARIRADLCRRGIKERPPQWSDADVDGWRPPPVPKSRKR